MEGMTGLRGRKMGIEASSSSISDEIWIVEGLGEVIVESLRFLIIKLQPRFVFAMKREQMWGAFEETLGDIP